MRLILFVLCALGVVGLVGAAPVRAARTTPGVVPSVAPLFPTPVGVEANVRGNVQFEGESVLSDPGNGATETDLGTEGGTGLAMPTPPLGEPAASPATPARRVWVVLWGVVGVVVIGAGGYWYSKQKRSV